MRPIARTLAAIFASTFVMSGVQAQSVDTSLESRFRKLYVFCASNKNLVNVRLSFKTSGVPVAVVEKQLDAVESKIIDVYRQSVETGASGEIAKALSMQIEGMKAVIAELHRAGVPASYKFESMTPGRPCTPGS